MRPSATARFEEVDDAERFHAVPRGAAQAVEQVEVEVVGPEAFELLGEEPVHVAALPAEAERHLRREVDALAPTAGERFPHKRLALAHLTHLGRVVEVRGVDVVDAVVDGEVQHLGRQVVVDLVGLTADDRQAHATEPEYRHVDAGLAELAVEHPCLREVATESGPTQLSRLARDPSPEREERQPTCVLLLMA